MFLVLLHGHDSTPTDLSSPASALVAEELGEVARFAGWCTLATGRHAWWDDAGEFTGAAAATAQLRVVLDTELRRRMLGWDDLVLIGFSQGAALALMLGCDGHPAAPLGVACVAGFPPEGLALAHARMRSLLVVHGEADDVVDPVYAGMIARQVRKAGVAVTEAFHPGGHVWAAECNTALIAWLHALAPPWVGRPRGEAGK